MLLGQFFVLASEFCLSGLQLRCFCCGLFFALADFVTGLFEFFPRGGRLLAALFSGGGVLLNLLLFLFERFPLFIQLTAFGVKTIGPCLEVMTLLFELFALRLEFSSTVFQVLLLGVEGFLGSLEFLASGF